MRSAIKDDTRPLLRLLLRAKGLTGIPDARAQGRSTKPTPMRSSPRRAARNRSSPGIATRPPSSAPRRRSVAARADPVTDFQPFNYKIAWRSESVPVCSRGPTRAPRRPAAGTASARAHPDPLRRVRPAHAARGRRRRRRADSRGAARHGAVHRPLRRDERTQRLREERDRRLLRGPACGAVRERPAVHRAVAASADAALEPPGRTTATKTIAAVTATVRDVKLQFLGDEIAVGRATPSAPRSRGCAPVTRPRHRTGTTCAASSSSPA